MASLEDQSRENSEQPSAQPPSEPPASRFERLPDPWSEGRDVLASATEAQALEPDETATAAGTPPASHPLSGDLESLLSDLQQVLDRPSAAVVNPEPVVPPQTERQSATAKPAANPPETEVLPIAERSESVVPPVPNVEIPSLSEPPRAATSDAEALLEKLQSLAVDALNRQPLRSTATSESSLEIEELPLAVPSEPAVAENAESAAVDSEPPTEELMAIPIAAQPDAAVPGLEESQIQTPPVVPEPVDATAAETPAVVEPTAAAATEPAAPAVIEPVATESTTPVVDEFAVSEAAAAHSEPPLESEVDNPAAAPAKAFEFAVPAAVSNGASGAAEPSAVVNGAAASAANGSSRAGVGAPTARFRLGDRDNDPLDVLRELLLSPEPGIGAAPASAKPPAPPKRPRRPPAPPRPRQVSAPPAPSPSPASPPAAVDSEPPPAATPPESAETAVVPTEPAAIPSAGEVETTYLRQLIGNLEGKLEELEKQVYQPTEVINPLLPLIAQLMKHNVAINEEAVYSAVVPVLDRAIRERSDQDHNAMSQALAELIPDAIAEEIKRSPETIAKSLGPEMAAALREQVKLERDSISRALGPSMGRAIKEQIDLERDAMVDALYPVIGNTISKYMGEVVAQINEKVETALSPTGLRRKFQSKLQGVSEAELILQESMPTLVQAIFLIHKASGLVISEVQPSLEARLEPNMIAGMLTAIRSFVNDCIAQSGEISELNEIEYGDSHILLEVAGYCYLAVVVRGTPRQAFIKRMQRSLMLIVRKYGREIEEFDGDRTALPPELHNDLAALGESDIMTPDGKPRRRSFALLWLAAAVLAIILIPWTALQVRGVLARRLETRLETALADLDSQTYTTLDAEVRGGQVILQGRVPSETVKMDAEQMVAGVAPKFAEPERLDNRIIVVQDPSAVAMSVQLMAAAINRDPAVELTAEYQEGTVSLLGRVGETGDRQQIIESFEQLPGVGQVEAVKLAPVALQERIYFDLNSATLNPTDRSGKIAAVAAFLEENADAQLKIIGHSDELGTREINEVLARERATAVRDALEESGIDAERLAIEGIPDPPSDIAPDDPMWQSRCARFELVSAR